MQANLSPRSEREDESIQRAVLSLALAAYPKRLTIPKLALEFDQGEAVERAVVALVGIGLLECQGISLKPTPSALRFNGLELP